MTSSSSNKRPAGFDYEEKCFVCQSDIKDPNTKYRRNKPVVEVKDIESIKTQCEEWKSSDEKPDFITAALVVLDHVFRENENPKLVWH